MKTGVRAIGLPGNRVSDRPRLAHEGAQRLVVLRRIPCQPKIEVPGDGRHVREPEGAAQAFHEVSAPCCRRS